MLVLKVDCKKEKIWCFERVFSSHLESHIIVLGTLPMRTGDFYVLESIRVNSCQQALT